MCDYDDDDERDGSDIDDCLGEVIGKCTECGDNVYDTSGSYDSDGLCPQCYREAHGIGYGTGDLNGDLESLLGGDYEEDED